MVESIGKWPICNSPFQEKNQSYFITDLKIKTRLSIFCSVMKSLAAIWEGAIPYIEIPLVRASFFDDYWGFMDDKHEPELLWSYC